jgi:hypothetical protein
MDNGQILNCEIILKGRSTLRVFERGALNYWLEKKSLFVPQELCISREQRDVRATALRAAIDECVKLGLCVHEQTVDNLVVTAGKQMLCDLLIDEEDVGIGYHELGTGTTTPALTDAALTTSAVRKVVTSKVRSGNQVQVSTFFLASESTYDIKEAGIFGGAGASATPGSGRMLCHYLQSYNNSAGAYDLTFEYLLTIN